MRVIIILFLLLLISCSAEKDDGILERKSQAVEERNLLSVDVDHTIELGEYDFYSNDEIEVDDKNIYLADTDSNRILAMNKNDYDDYAYIGKGKGRGPGEISVLHGFDVRNGRIALLDRSNNKIAYYDTDGPYLKEFVVDENISSPHRIALAADYTIVASGPIKTGSIFFKLNEEGEIINHFEDSKVDNSAPMMDGVPTMLIYEGYIDSDEQNNMYFAGYSESVIRKYDEAGSLQYSLNSIEDDHDDLENYTQPKEDGDFVVMGYSENARFASAGLHLWNDYITIIKNDNSADGDSAMIDFYRQDNGSYVRTINLEHMPSDIAIDNDYIYTTRYLDDRPQLIVYENVMSDAE